MRRLIAVLAVLAALVAALLWQSRRTETNAPLAMNAPAASATAPHITELAPSEQQAQAARKRVAPVEADVVPDSGSGETQTAMVLSEGVLVGRVFVGKDPAPGARVVLSRESWRVKDGTLTRLPGRGESNIRTDLDAHAGRTRTEFAGTDGEFRFDTLATGTYALTVSADDAAPRFEREIRVQAGRTTDVGPINLTVGGILRGRLTTPPEQSPVGYEIRIYAAGAKDLGPNPIEPRGVKITAIDGHFEFRGLAAATYAAQWMHPDANSFSDSEAASVPRVTVSAGRVSEIVLDASNTSPCTVAVSVLRRGAPFAGARVLALVQMRHQTGSWSGTDIGITDAQGRVEGKIEGGLHFRLQIYEAGKGPLLVDAEEDIEAIPRGRIEREFNVEMGTLVLVLPAGMTPPEKGEISVTLSYPQWMARTIIVATSGWRPGANRIEWMGPVIALGNVAAGRYPVRVSFRRFDADPAQTNKFAPTELRPDFTTEIDVRADAETRIEVR